MADLKELEQALNTYIRPLTFPLAIKMLKSEEEIPEKTRRPFQLLEDMVNTGMPNASIDAPTDLAKAVEVTRGKAVLIGNLDTNLFITGSRDKMKQAIQNCIDKAPKDSGYILASGCEVPAIAPPERIDWFMELVNELGRYD